MQHQVKIFIPEGLSSKSPYFYITKHLSSDKLYVGIKYHKPTCDSSTFMTENGYQTSSTYVRDLIKTDGIDSFEILRIRHFATPEEVCDYEDRFLRKVNVLKNTRFLNANIGGKEFRCKEFTDMHRKKISESNMGRKHSQETRNKLSKAARNRQPISEDTREKNRIAATGRKHTETSKEKNRITSTGRKHTKTSKEKISRNKKGKTHSKESREKMRLSRKNCKLWTNGHIKKYFKECPGDEWTLVNQRY